jgi:site-specific recombinase XerD
VERFAMWHSKPIASIKKSFDLAVSASGLPSEIAPYSLRHSMAKDLRKRSVPAREVD